MKKAFALLKTGACDDAKLQFSAATAENNSFTALAKYDQYLSTCYGGKASTGTSTSVFSGVTLGIKNFFGGYSSLQWLVFVAVGVLLVFIALSLRVLLRAAKKKRSSGTWSSKEGKTVRNEEVQNARRTPASEKSSATTGDKKEAAAFEIKPEPDGNMFSGNDDVIFPKKTDARTSSSDQDTSKPVFNTISGPIVKKSDRAELKSDDVSGLPKQRDAVFGDIPKGDKERLAKLWPTKYKVFGEDDADEQPKASGAAIQADVVKSTQSEAAATPVQVQEPEETVLAAVAYISSTRALGFSNDEIRDELIRTGWDAKDVERAFLMAK